MKNIFSFLLISLLLIGCNNEQDETFDNVQQNEEVKLKTRSNENKRILPPVYLGIDHESVYLENEILFDIPSPSEEYKKKVLQDYGIDLSYHQDLNYKCYIQYRIYTNKETSDWYYYHPDSIRCKSPYLIDTEPDKEFPDARHAKLKSYMFPADDFQYRVKIFNSYFETDWPEYHSFESWLGNNKGFTDRDPSINEETCTLVNIEVQFSMNVIIDTRDSYSGGVYTAFFGDQSQYIPYKSSSYDTTTVHFTYHTTKKVSEPYKIHYVWIPYSGGTWKTHFYIKDDFISSSDIIRLNSSETVIVRME